MRWFHPLLVLLLAGVLPLSGRGQRIAAAASLADLRYLETAVRARRGPYDTAAADRMAAYTRQLEEAVAHSVQPVDSMPLFQHRLRVGHALQLAGDGHLLVLRSPSGIPVPRYFPLPVAPIGSRLVLLPPCTGCPAGWAGRAITAVNGQSSDTIVSQLLQYAAADSVGTQFAERIAGLSGAVLLTALLGAPASYEITVDGGAETLTAAPTPPAGLPRHPLGSRVGTAIRAHGVNALYRSDSSRIAVLAVGRFGRGDRALFRQAFRQLRAVPPSGLVLDLRGNTGGQRKAAVALTRHLVSAPFEYRLLRPRGQRLQPVLNAQGRLFLALARFKYGATGLARTVRTPEGNAVRFRYRPHRHPYAGRVVVLTDGLTFSAATMVASWLKQDGRATFIGTKTGGGYNGNGGGAFPRLTLPYSRMVVQLPAYRLVLDPRSPCTGGIEPDVSRPLTADALLTGRDAALEAAREVLSRAAK